MFGEKKKEIPDLYFPNQTRFLKSIYGILRNRETCFSLIYKLIYKLSYLYIKRLN